MEIKEKYKELCESMLGYGIRRCIQGEAQHNNVTKELQQLEEDCNKLAKSVEELDKDAVEKEEKAKTEDAQLEKDHQVIVDEKKTKITKFKNDIKDVLTSHKGSS